MKSAKRTCFAGGRRVDSMAAISGPITLPIARVAHLGTALTDGLVFTEAKDRDLQQAEDFTSRKWLVQDRD
ncbi:MAG: hypothetical protein ABIY40_02585, partial [Rhodanobacteraceae bacterium]